MRTPSKQRLIKMKFKIQSKEKNADDDSWKTIFEANDWDGYFQALQQVHSYYHDPLFQYRTLYNNKII